MGFNLYKSLRSEIIRRIVAMNAPKRHQEKELGLIFVLYKIPMNGFEEE
jgi:hypothetical protein